jgi:Predicted aminoglycoside phosphotransferase
MAHQNDYDEVRESTPEGYDVVAVESWIKSNVEGVAPPFEWTRLEGGHSNLTYSLMDKSGRKAVIRRPPRGELLPKAHDMAREWAIISALGATNVPVAPALAFYPDADITGAHFYIMGHVEGQALHSSGDTEFWVPENKRRALAESFMTVLAALHSLEPDSLGLGELGKKENYIGRQLKTWYRSWNASTSDADYDDARLHEIQSY